MNSEILWYASRATGVTSALLFTAVLVLGIATAGRLSHRASTATVVMALHRWLSLASVAFLGIHIATAVIDTYVTINLIDVLVPFRSSYQTLWVGLGTVAIDIFLAVLITSLLRQRLPESAWRVVHWLAYTSWPVAMMHAIGMASADQPFLLAVALGCLAIGGGAIAWRLISEHADRKRRLEVRGQVWA